MHSSELIHKVQTLYKLVAEMSGSCKSTVASVNKLEHAHYIDVIAQ